MAERGWLVIFAKAPRPGLVKTRFSPPLSPDQCAAFYEAMLEDVLEASARFAKALDLQPILAFHPPDAASELVHRAAPGFRLHAQRGLGLAERMANAFAEGAAAGTPCVLLRGSDSPALTFEQVEDALLQLESGKDAVFTPDQGGGYALIGQRSPHAELFEVTMSTGSMLGETLRVADQLGLSTGQTRPGFDLDRTSDLAALEALPAEQTSDLCPRTVEAVLTLQGEGLL